MKKEKGAAAGKAIVIWMLVALLLVYVFFALDSPIKKTIKTSNLGFDSVAAEVTAPSSFSLTLRPDLNWQPMSVSGYCVVQTADGGYAVAGDSYPYSETSLFKINANGSIKWQQTYENFMGRPNAFYVSMFLTSDGGYALAGYRPNGLKPVFAVSFLVKTDANGSTQWQRMYSTYGIDCGSNSVVQTSDGGYALAGYDNDYNNGSYHKNVWLFKMEENGTVNLDKKYGGVNDEYGYSVIQTGDGGYAIAGCTNSFGAGDMDAYLIKTDASGTMLWNQTYGGAGTDYGYSVVQTIDGGYVVAGYTNSFGAGNFDVYLIKTDANGQMQWSKTYGGINDDSGYSIVKTSDGGYAVTGYTYSFGSGGKDAWLIKMDSGGNMQWNKTYGGKGTDGGSSVIQASDGGYAIAGYTDSFGNGGSWRSSDASEVWLIKTDGNGNAPPLPLNPTIGILSREPADDVQPNQSVKISANVTNTAGQLQNVTLYYSNHWDNYSGSIYDITWQGPILMSFNASTILYEGLIPGQSGGTAILFKVVAINDALATATSDGSPYTVTQVIPEYPSILVLPILMIPTLLIALISFKKRKR